MRPLYAKCHYYLGRLFNIRWESAVCLGFNAVNSKRMEGLQKETGVKDFREVINDAIDLYEVVVRHKKMGDQIIAYNEIDNSHVELRFESFNDIKPWNLDKDIAASDSD